MKNLKKIDKIAYIRYASVYQSFEDLEEFSEELDKLLKKRKLNKMQREIVYKNDMLNDIMNLKFNKTFSSPIDKENSNSMPIRDRIEFELEFDYLYDF